LHLFAGMFFQHLPRELRILLTHDDLADLKMLMARADALHIHHLDRDGGVGVSPSVEAMVVAVARGRARPPRRLLLQTLHVRAVGLHVL
jgi:hypothetical protein